MNTFNYISVFPKTPAYQLGKQKEITNHQRDLKFTWRDARSAGKADLKISCFTFSGFFKRSQLCTVWVRTSTLPLFDLKKRNEQKGILP